MYAFGVLLTRLFEDPEATPAEIERLRLRCLAADPASRPTALEAQAILATRVSGLTVYSGRTVSLPVPVPVAAPVAAGGLPPTGYLPPPIQLTLHRPLRRPVRRWSLVATALLLAAAGLSCLAVAVEQGARASTEATLPDPTPTTTQPSPAAPAPPPTQSGSSASDSSDEGSDGFAAAISSACESEARRRNEALSRLAELRAHGHKITLNASIVCRNGVPVLRVSR
jgi:hypothetical protein